MESLYGPRHSDAPVTNVVGPAFDLEYIPSARLADNIVHKEIGGHTLR